MPPIPPTRDPVTGLFEPPRTAPNADGASRRGYHGCDCVAMHHPKLYQTRHFFVTPDESYWICPTTWANVKELLKEYALAGGEPTAEVQRYFSYFVRSLANRSWFLDKYRRKHAKNSLR